MASMNILMLASVLVACQLLIQLTLASDSEILSKASQTSSPATSSKSAAPLAGTIDALSLKRSQLKEEARISKVKDAVQQSKKSALAVKNHKDHANMEHRADDLNVAAGEHKKYVLVKKKPKHKKIKMEVFKPVIKYKKIKMKVPVKQMKKKKVKGYLVKKHHHHY